jgi:hypothetical protein
VLRREQAWLDLVEQAAAEGRKIVPYSCRHSYALRAHETYGLSPRVTASLMGHGLPVHLQHYGAWTDAGTVDEAIAKATARLAVEYAMAG